MENDWTILQACEKIGLFIPRFCYSESLSIAGNCRMCLVEIENAPKLMPSCAIKTAQNMKIHTKTNLVKKTRESILEFLLINHPLDCPICDQGGECDLQDQAMIYGSDRGRFYEYKRSLEDKNHGPLIKTIMTRCIHCTRCIRFATEIAGVEAYGTTGRGKNMQVGTYISRLFNSELSGNVIDLCPVGALTSKPYAFTVRPWELKSIESIDVLDAIGSNIIINTRGSELMRILPKSNDDINQQWISDKTRFSYDGLKSQRLQNPMIKKDKTYVTINWKDALTLIKKQFDQTRSFNKVLTIKAVIGPFIDQQSILSLKNFVNRLGSNKLFVQHDQHEWNPVQSNTLGNTSLNLDFRSNFLLNTPLNHLETQSSSVSNSSSVDFVLLLGSNPRYEAPALNVRLRQLVLRKNVFVYYIGFPMDLTYNAKQLGINMKTLKNLFQGKNAEFIKKLILAKNPFILLGTSLLQRKDGLAIIDVLNAILLLREKIYLQLLQQKKQDNLLLERKSFSIISKYFKSLVGSPLNKQDYIKTNPWKAINILHTQASTPGALDLGFYNPKNSWTNPSPDTIIYLMGADYKLDKIKNYQVSKEANVNPFIIYQGHHGDLGAKQADLILPSTSYVEKKGLYMNTEGRLQQSQIATQPSGQQAKTQARDDWKIIKALESILNISSYQSAHSANPQKSLDEFLSGSIQIAHAKENLFQINQSNALTAQATSYISFLSQQEFKSLGSINSNDIYISTETELKPYTGSAEINKKWKIQNILTRTINAYWYYSKSFFITWASKVSNLSNPVATNITLDQQVAFENISPYNRDCLINTQATNNGSSVSDLISWSNITPKIITTNNTEKAIEIELIKIKNWPNSTRGGYNKILSTNLTPLTVVDNFYLSDVISKSSKVMSKCSIQLKKFGSFFQNNE